MAFSLVRGLLVAPTCRTRRHDYKLSTPPAILEPSTCGNCGGEVTSKDMQMMHACRYRYKMHIQVYIYVYIYIHIICIYIYMYIYIYTHLLMYFLCMCACLGYTWLQPCIVKR